nr:MAG: putative 8.2 kDa protein [Picris umbravirus 1]
MGFGNSLAVNISMQKYSAGPGLPVALSGVTAPLRTPRAPCVRENLWWQEARYDAAPVGRVIWRVTQGAPLMSSWPA